MYNKKPKGEEKPEEESAVAGPAMDMEVKRIAEEVEKMNVDGDGDVEME